VQAGRHGGLLDLARVHVVRVAGLGRQQHDEPRVGEVGQGVDERVDEVAVALPEPDEDRVGDVGILLVLELSPREVLDRDPQVVVDVAVPAELLHDLAFPEPQLGQGPAGRSG
jgi:hypothetical protein